MNFGTLLGPDLDRARPRVQAMDPIVGHSTIEPEVGCPWRQILKILNSICHNFLYPQFISLLRYDVLAWHIIPVDSIVPSEIEKGQSWPWLMTLSKMTIISKASVCISASDSPQNGDFSSISWQIIRGVTKNSLSAPVLNPMLISVWSKGINSPSDVCFDRTNFARILHWTINEFRRFPTLKNYNSTQASIEQSPTVPGQYISL